MYNGKRVVISMTSWEKRINGEKPIIVDALNSLLSQEYVDEIVINLSIEEFPKRERELPTILTKNDKISIYWVYGNTRAFKKLIPTLNQEKYQDCIVITCDDDVVYPQGIIKEALFNYNVGHSPMCFNVPPTYNWGNGRLSIYEYKYFGKALNLFERKEIWETNNDDVAYGFLLLLNGYKYQHTFIDLYDKIQFLDKANDMHINEKYNIHQDYIKMEKYILNRFGLSACSLISKDKGMFAVEFDYDKKENNDNTNKLV